MEQTAQLGHFVLALFQGLKPDFMVSRILHA